MKYEVTVKRKTVRVVDAQTAEEAKATAIAGGGEAKDDVAITVSAKRLPELTPKPNEPPPTAPT